MAEYSRYVVPVLIVGALVISLFIIKPFIIPLITSAIVAYTFYPFFNWVNEKLIKNKTLAAVFVALFIFILITIPILMVVNTISREAYIIYMQGKELLSNGLLLENCTSTICATMSDWLSTTQVRASIQKALGVATTYLIENTSKFIVALPRRAVELFITLFATFYILRDGDKLTQSITNLLATRKRKSILNRFNSVMYGVIFGSLLVALVQGIVGAIGFALFGVSSPITWGIAMFFLALIPYIGTGLIWGPASLLLIIEGVSDGQNSLIWKGIGLLLYGVLVISSIDNVLKPKIIGHHSRVHPVLVLVGIFGGLALMGVPGIIVGPVVLAMTMTFLELYVHEDSLNGTQD